MYDYFEYIFIVAAVTYSIEFLARVVILVGLLKAKINLQILGAGISIFMSNFGQTTLMIIIPVFRWNEAGILCS